MLTVPEPLPDDPEAVVTALETAEIFGKQGDVKEAVRWVRRAAEIAGDEGNDLRALNLARAIADINISSSRAPEPPPPPPPRLPGDGATSDDPDADAETRVVDSQQVLAEFQKQTAASTQGNGAAPTAAAVAEAADLTKDAMPEGETVTHVMKEADAAELAKAAEEATPSKRSIGSMAELLARKEAEVSSARAAAEAVPPPEGAWDDPPPPPPPAAQASVLPQAVQASTPPVERRSARPVGERISTPLIPSQPYTERPPVQAPIHQAVRASVVATAEPGVYVLRVLAAGQAPAPTAQEVFVVVADPTLNPFGHR
jgi:hypothetical protein